MRIPNSIGRLLTNPESDENGEEFRTYTLEEVNELILKLPQGRRRAMENEIKAWQHWKELEWEKKKAYAQKNIEVCKPGWKDIYSSAKDRDSAILLDPKVQELELKCIEAEAMYKKAAAISEQMQENLNSVKKTYEAFLRDDANIRKYPTYGG